MRSRSRIFPEADKGPTRTEQQRRDRRKELDIFQRVHDMFWGREYRPIQRKEYSK